MNHNQEPDDQLIVAASAFELVVRAGEAADAAVIPIIDRADFATDLLASRFLDLALLAEGIKIVETTGRASRAEGRARNAVHRLYKCE